MSFTYEDCYYAGDCNACDQCDDCDTYMSLEESDEAIDIMIECMRDEFISEWNEYISEE